MNRYEGIFSPLSSLLLRSMKGPFDRNRSIPRMNFSVCPAPPSSDVLARGETYCRISFLDICFHVENVELPSDRWRHPGPRFPVDVCLKELGNRQKIDRLDGRARTRYQRRENWVG